MSGSSPERAIYSVTVARWVSFVRTLMPMAAGMSRLRFSTYLLYEAPGVVGWVLLYVAVGVLAGESWERATQVVGVGGAVAFAAAGLALWITVRRRAARRSPLDDDAPSHGDQA